MKPKAIIAATLMSFVLILASGCMSLRERKPLSIGSVMEPLPSHPNAVVVRFEESLPGAPLEETVWDNAVGPFHDVKESTQIGFTQHYHPQFYAIPPALLPVAAQSGANFVDSQIVIPFGRIFTGVFDSGLKQAWPKHTVCADDKCEEDATSTDGSAARLHVHIETFFVWEEPLNHINFYVKGSAALIEPGGQVVQQIPFEESILQHSCGSVLSTHASFIKEMNRTANQLAEKVVTGIFQNAAR